MSKDDSNVPGTGVDPQKVCVPRKRLKNAHRKAVKGGKRVSLKGFVRGLDDGELAEFGIGWFDNKKPSAQAEAKKAKRKRLAPLRVMKARPGEGGKKKK